MKFEIVRIGLEHLDGILRVQERAYSPQFHEKAETFVSKIKFSPKTCYGIISNGVLCAYGISFPWSSNTSVPLNTKLNDVVKIIDTMHIHDISVDPDYRGHGFADILFQRIAHDAFMDNLESISLVAVQDSSSFWQRFGFEVVNQNVDDYGTEAKKMSLKIKRIFQNYEFRPTALSNLVNFYDFNSNSHITVGNEFNRITLDELRRNFDSPSWFHGELVGKDMKIVATCSLQRLENRLTRIEAFCLPENSTLDEVSAEFWQWLEMPFKILTAKKIICETTELEGLKKFVHYSNWNKIENTSNYVCDLLE